MIFNCIINSNNKDYVHMNIISKSIEETKDCYIFYYEELRLCLKEEEFHRVNDYYIKYNLITHETIYIHYDNLMEIINRSINNETLDRIIEVKDYHNKIQHIDIPKVLNDNIIVNPRYSNFLIASLLKNDDITYIKNAFTGEYILKRSSYSYLDKSNEIMEYIKVKDINSYDIILSKAYFRSLGKESLKKQSYQVHDIQYHSIHHIDLHSLCYNNANGHNSNRDLVIKFFLNQDIFITVNSLISRDRNTFNCTRHYLVELYSKEMRALLSHNPTLYPTSIIRLTDVALQSFMTNYQMVQVSIEKAKNHKWIRIKNVNKKDLIIHLSIINEIIRKKIMNLPLEKIMTAIDYYKHIQSFIPEKVINDYFRIGSLESGYCVYSK